MPNVNVIFFKKYIRVQNKTAPIDMIQYMYSEKGWNLPRPQLILSVTGGAKKFTIQNRTKNAFKRGLIKAAKSTGAWIITGGTNTGVMKLVGEAVSDELDQFNLVIPVIGIATWGKIQMKEKLINKVSSLFFYLILKNFFYVLLIIKKDTNLINLIKDSSDQVQNSVYISRFYE